MDQIKYYDRITKEIEIEKVYGERVLKFLYSGNFLGTLSKNILCRHSFFSRIYGTLMNLSFSKRLIPPFIENYSIDTSEFEQNSDSFRSFNEFFIRKLKTSARPIHQSEAVIPADGRYYFYSNLSVAFPFFLKGEKFDLNKLLQDEFLTKEFEEGSLLIGRLCPADYHRFHFPCHGLAKQARLINGYYFSVSPFSMKQNLSHLTQNKRMITEIESSAFGKFLYIEVGATNVASIHQTYQCQHMQKKGDEKGFFSFGGSTIVLIFKKNKITFDKDLTDTTAQGLETRCLMGQSMGQRVKEKKD